MIGNEGMNNGLFMAETEAEESLMLMGKVNALEAICKWNPELICADMIKALFGFEDVVSEEVKAAEARTKNAEEKYWRAVNHSNNLLGIKIQLEKLCDRYKELYGELPEEDEKEEQK